MTDEQKEAVKNAISAFIAARNAGVKESLLIDEVLDASNEWTISNLKALKNGTGGIEQDGWSQERILGTKIFVF